MMLLRSTASLRSGSILPLVVVSLIALCAFVAFAVDLGMMVAAKTQCQNAADCASLAGARTITGAAGGNLTQATANALAAATSNAVLSQPIVASQVSIQNGAYHYDPNSQTFYPQFPPVSPDNYNLCQVNVTATQNNAFARALGLSTFTVSATSTAAHRPRDTCVVLDYSGSMNNESDLWNCESYLGSMINTSNNTDSVFPTYAWYNPNLSPLAKLQCTSSDPRVGKCNVTVSVAGVPPLVNDFYQNAYGSGPVGAFAPAPSSITNSNPGGDQPLTKSGGSAPAVTIQDYMGSGSTFTTGYCTNGYTQGPGYWGMTFFFWPPDPANDWRQLYFLDTSANPFRTAYSPYPSGAVSFPDNTKLPILGTGGFNNPPGNYKINYKAILAWIAKNCVQQTPGDGRPFPVELRGGDVIYYSYVPTDVPAAAYNHMNNNVSIAWPDYSTRFWKEYIDYVLGVWRDPFGAVQNAATPSCSIGNDFTCVATTSGANVSLSGPDGTTYTDQNNNTFTSMKNTDNPKRPRHRFWFGPMTMIQYISDSGLFPGTVHDISMYMAKLGIANALVDIQNNHPNDLVSMILFSRPVYANDPAGVGAFSQVQYSLSNNYTSMINSLWFPPSFATGDCNPWDKNGVQTPRAHGDYCANTATSYGFMLAYNQFSSNAGMRSILTNGQAAGGLGRVGSQRLVILETDGMANVDSVPSPSWFTNNGPNNSNYNILPTQTVNGASYNTSNLLQIAQAICNKPDGTPGNGSGAYTPNPGYPGFSGAKPVLIHTLAFGAIMEPTASGSEQSSVVSLLQAISSIGSTVFPSSSSDPANGYKWVIGSLSDREAKMTQAFTRIMDDGAAVVLVK
jgi:Flp pilus assembly protein TadG